MMYKFVKSNILPHFQGWHSYGPGMALRNKKGERTFTEGELSELTDMYAPYGARLMAILRHTDLDLPCLKTEQGEQLRHKLEEVRVHIL